MWLRVSVASRARSVVPRSAIRCFFCCLTFERTHECVWTGFLIARTGTSLLYGSPEGVVNGLMKFGRFLCVEKESVLPGLETVTTKCGRSLDDRSSPPSPRRPTDLVGMLPLPVALFFAFAGLTSYGQTCRRRRWPSTWLSQTGCPPCPALLRRG